MRLYGTSPLFEPVNTDEYLNPYYSVSAKMGTEEESRSENADNHDHMYTQMRISSRHSPAGVSDTSTIDEKDAYHDRHERSK